MNRFTLLLRNLSYFRAANVAVIAGMAVATAVLAGAMMVGDSVKGSLQDLAAQRTGPVDYALVSARFFDQGLAKRLSEAKGYKDRFEDAVPAISLRGGAANGDVKTGGVQILGMGPWVKVGEDHAIINGELADAIGFKGGGPISMLLPLVSDQPKDAALAQRGLDYVRTRLAIARASVERSQGFVSLFSLSGGQRTPMNAWVSLPDLQRELYQSGHGTERNTVNLLLVHSRDGKSDLAGAMELNRLLHSVAELGDYGLEFKADPNTGESALMSKSTYIPSAVQQAASAVAKELNAPLRQVSVYLVNHLAKIDGNKAIHYSMAAGVSSLPEGPIGDNEVVINQWAADQLGAKVGDELRLELFQRQANGEFKDVQADSPLRVGRILPMKGFGADPPLTPEYKGLTDARSISSWQKPEGLDINTKLVTPADEEYWKTYKAAPKMFVSLNTAKRLWGTVYGEINSVRVPSAKAEQFKQALLSRLEPSMMGMAFAPIKGSQLAAAGQGTDFAGLFIGFSFFLIVSALILVAMLFRLGIEQRARQFGVLGAVGFGPGSLMRLALGEGVMLALIGGIVGVGLGVGYTALMMAGLRTWWKGAVGTTAMRLHVLPETLISGLVTGVIVAMLAVFFSAWRLRKADAATLLAGGWGHSHRVVGKRRISLMVFFLGLLGCIGMGAVAVGSKAKPEITQYAQLGEGTFLLIGLLGLASYLLGWRRATAAALSTATLGFRNAARHRGRSIMTVALIAFATFSMVVVAAFKEGPPANVRQIPSGTGGFPLLLTSDVPILGNLNTAKGRELDGIRNSTDPIWSKAEFTQLRMWAGQDASCLNMTRPTSPTILGVPSAMLRDRFNVGTKADAEALASGIQQDQVPVIADQETAEYILHLEMGKALPIIDQTGRKRELKLAGTLGGSIFQSELLMDEKNFRELFPSQAGFNVVLVDAPDDVLPELRKDLAEELGDFSITIESTGERLARYREVANTYLSTFRVLGSLGLLLGTIGLAVILLRGLVERRAELSLLSALGFGSGRRTMLVLSENAFLLVTGLLTGTISALVGIQSAIMDSRRSINLGELALTLAGILVFGLLVLLLTTRFAGRRTTAADLRHE